MRTVAGAAQAGRGAPSCFPFTFGALRAPEAPVRGVTVALAAVLHPFCYHHVSVFLSFFAFSPHFRDSPVSYPRLPYPPSAYTRGGDFARLLGQRILILDGAMGTMIQRYKLGE